MFNLPYLQYYHFIITLLITDVIWNAVKLLPLACRPQAYKAKQNAAQRALHFAWLYTYISPNYLLKDLKGVYLPPKPSTIVRVFAINIPV